MCPAAKAAIEKRAVTAALKRCATQKHGRYSSRNRARFHIVEAGIL
jgi:hypothetical protein